MNAIQRIWWSALVAICVVWALPGARTADAANSIQGLEVEELEDATVIRVLGSENPTYSSYRLRQPARLFVDFADASLEAQAERLELRDGVISSIALTEEADELVTVVRLTVTFETEALYEVSNDGSDLVVRIDASNRRQPSDAVASTSDAQSYLAELVQAQERIAALEEAAANARAQGNHDQAEVFQRQLAQEQAQRARLENDMRELSEQVETLSSDANALRAALAASEAERQALVADRQSLAVAADSEREQSAALQGDIDRLREREAQLDEQLRQLQSSQGASAEELESLEAQRDEARRQAESFRNTLDQMQAERQAQQARIDAQERELEELRSQRAEDQRAQAAPAPQAQPAAQAQPEPAAPASPSIRDIRFEQQADAYRVVIESDSPIEVETTTWEEGVATMILRDATLPLQLQRRLDTQAFAGPISSVAAYIDADDQARVAVELSGIAGDVVSTDGNITHWEFRAEQPQPTAARTTSQAQRPQAAASARPAGSVQQQVFGATPRRPRMPNRRITIELRGAPVANVLRLFAEEGNLNFVADSDVSGNVTVRLRSVPLDEAFVFILRSQELGWVQDGNIIRIARIETLMSEQNAYMESLAAEREAEEAIRRSAPLSVRIVPINFAEADDVASLLEPMLSERGSIAIDERTNSLILTDFPEHLAAAQELSSQLDSQTPQILIEARIVETNDNFVRQLGIQWGGDFVADQALGNSTGLLFPSTIGIAGASTDGSAPTAGTSSSPNFAVNLPAPVGTGAGGGVGFTFGSLSGAFNLNLRLTAAEATGSVKIVSAPRIMTLDNESASISSGVSIPISVVSAAGAQTVFFDAALSLDVTPRVTPDGNIFLEVNVNKSEPDFQNTGARGDPSIIRRQAQTQLLVRDGDTTVIGGIFQRNTGFSTSSVPYFSRIPIIGPLFRNSSRTDSRNEMLVFITPRIVNRDLSIDRIGGSMGTMPSRD